MKATDVLLQLAADFVQQKRYVEAVKCLQPVSESSELPLTKVKARLALAQLLLAHFDNEAEARQQLKQADLELRHTACTGRLLLQCEVADSLGRCHRLTGDVVQEKEAYTVGLQAAKQSASAAERAVLARWQAYFVFRLAEHAIQNDGAERGLVALEALDSQQTLTLHEQASAVLHLLCRGSLQLQASLLKGSAQQAAMEATNASLTAASGLMDAMVTPRGAALPGVLALRVHHNILYVSMALASGQIKSIRQDEDFPVLAQLHSFIAEAQRSAAAGEDSGSSGKFQWMPLPAVAALAHLLHSALLRGLGKIGQASVHLARGQEMVTQELGQFPLDLNGVEASIGKAVIFSDGMLYARLHMLLLEEEALMALVTSEFARAAMVLSGMMSILDRFPVLLREFVPSVQMLAGHYAHSVSEYGAAVAHFARLLEDEDALNLHNLAALAAASSELHRDPGPGGINRAVHVLQAQDLAETRTLALLPVHERAAGHLVNGLLGARQEDEKVASMQLTLALKQAHDSLHNTQLVAQVLNALSPISAAKQDSDGAKQMLDAAYVLAKALGDTSSLVTTLLGTEKLYEQLGDAGRLAKNKDYTQKKAAGLHAKIAEARGSAEHRAVLNWAPAGQRTPQ